MPLADCLQLRRAVSANSLTFNNVISSVCLLLNLFLHYTWQNTWILSHLYIIFKKSATQDMHDLAAFSFSI